MCGCGGQPKVQAMTSAEMEADAKRRAAEAEEALRAQRESLRAALTNSASR